MNKYYEHSNKSYLECVVIGSSRSSSYLGNTPRVQSTYALNPLESLSTRNGEHDSELEKQLFEEILNCLQDGVRQR